MAEIDDKFRLGKYPFRQVLSFEPLLNYLKEKAKSGNQSDKELANRIVKKAENVPELFKDSPDKSIIEKNYSLLTNMLSFIISPFQQEENMWGAAVPIKFDYFFTTKKMDEIFGKKAKSLFTDFFESLEGGEDYMGPALRTYGVILKKFYGANMNFAIPTFTIEKFDKKLKILRYFDHDSDQRFIDIVPTGKLKKLNDEDIYNLSNNFFDIGLLLKTIPPENFEIRGFSISSIVESTKKQSVSSLKNKLLEKDALVSKDHFSKLEKRMQSLLKLHDLKIGVAVFNFEGQKFNDYMSGWQTLLPEPSLICDHYDNSIYEKAINDKIPVIISDLEKKQNLTVIEKSLLKAGYRSLIVSPLYSDDTIVGALEMGSPNKGDLNHLSMIEMCEVLPLFALAAFRVTVDLKNKVKAKIQEEFTAIHPVVEWRFTEAVSNMLKEERGEDKFEKEPIIFNDVYPLYGATDIRSSSHERNKAIKNDLAEQLNIADKILDEANNYKSMPVFNQVRFEIGKQLKKLKEGLLSGDEVRIIEFLKREVEPVFLHIKEAIPKTRDAIVNYEKKIDPEHGILYKKRNDFEVSLRIINDAISSVLDEQEESAQLMFPHYFEKYRTDGIEYNIYMGQSILEKLKFDPLYLKNLRLWQLIVTCQITRKTAEVKSKLPIQLDTTQLILVHSNPLAIRFREDEKKFDVEGGYNIRYEITKKRIDKAVIKETKERLTQPGYIAIIYSQPNEYYEYKKYVDYLASINYIQPEIENVELEDMQGIYGLKAMRVEVNLNDNHENELNNMEKIVDEARKIVL